MAKSSGGKGGGGSQGGRSGGSVNECDPLRDEGINFYHLLLRAGVPASRRQEMGIIHGTEIFPMTCPEISRETARSIADFCRGTTRQAASIDAGRGEREWPPGFKKMTERPYPSNPCA